MRDAGVRLCVEATSGGCGLVAGRERVGAQVVLRGAGTEEAIQRRVLDGGRRLYRDGAGFEEEADQVDRVGPGPLPGKRDRGDLAGGSGCEAADERRHVFRMGSSNAI